MTWFRRLLMRCRLVKARDTDSDRRIVSAAGRERYAEFSRERADVERRLELVDMQTKVIEHVTNTGRTPS